MLEQPASNALFGGMEPIAANRDKAFLVEELCVAKQDLRQLRRDPDLFLEEGGRNPHRLTGHLDNRLGERGFGLQQQRDAEKSLTSATAPSTAFPSDVLINSEIAPANGK